MSSETLQTHGAPIALIGLMGCGKSTVGRELSRACGFPFLDTDAVIEQQIGSSIRDIFATRGEAHFRALETALLRYIENSPELHPTIISTGGGIVLPRENREILRRMGFTVWLDVDVPNLLLRTARSSNRPLLSDETQREATLTRLLQQRRSFYEQSCHLRIDSSAMQVQEVVDLILSQARAFFAARS